MKKLIFLAAGCIFLFSCNNEKKDDSATVASSDTTAVTAKAEVPPTEIIDYKYTDMAKNLLNNLSSGNIEGYMSDYADTAVYVWNSGDSLAGKKAITDYWTKRRMETVDSLKFSNQIWLPINVNKPQSVEQPGKWLLGWFLVNAKYKTGKKMAQWMHMDIHLNSADKIDRLIQYRDNTPILAATAK